MRLGSGSGVRARSRPQFAIIIIMILGLKIRREVLWMSLGIERAQIRFAPSSHTQTAKQLQCILKTFFCRKIFEMRSLKFEDIVLGQSRSACLSFEDRRHSPVRGLEIGTLAPRSGVRVQGTGHHSPCWDRPISGLGPWGTSYLIL